MSDEKVLCPLCQTEMTTYGGIVECDNQNCPVFELGCEEWDAITQKIATLTAERDAARKDAETLRGTVKQAQAKLRSTQVNWYDDTLFECDKLFTAALLSPAPQPAPAPEPATPQPSELIEDVLNVKSPDYSVHNTRKMDARHIGTPALSRYAAAQIAKASAVKSDEREGKK